MHFSACSTLKICTFRYYTYHLVFVSLVRYENKKLITVDGSKKIEFSLSLDIFCIMGTFNLLQEFSFSLLIYENH